MRSLVVLVVLAFAAPASAQPDQPAPSPPMTENRDAKPEWKGPSGFWTNPRPAKSGAYRWRMMAVGGGVLVMTGWLVFRLINKHKR